MAHQFDYFVPGFSTSQNHVVYCDGCEDTSFSMACERQSCLCCCAFVQVVSNPAISNL